MDSCSDPSYALNQSLEFVRDMIASPDASSCACEFVNFWQTEKTKTMKYRRKGKTQDFLYLVLYYFLLLPLFSSCFFPYLQFLFQKIKLNSSRDNNSQQMNQDRKNVAAVVGESYSSVTVQVFESRSLQSNRTCFSWQTYSNFFVLLKSVQRARAQAYQIKVNSRSLRGKLRILFLI